MIFFERHESLPWNPLIARAFYRRGIIEEWGRGTLKMVDLSISAGLQRPEIEDAKRCVTVRFRRGMVTHVPKSLDFYGGVRFDVRISGLNERQRAILDLLRQADHPMALREIHESLSASMNVRQVRWALTRLKELDLAATAGRGLAVKWRPLKAK